MTDSNERLEKVEKLLREGLEAMCDLCATLTDHVPQDTATDLMDIRLRLLDALVA